MGGFGSGKSYKKMRPWKRGKIVTDYLPKLDISKTVKELVKNKTSGIYNPPFALCLEDPEKTLSAKTILLTSMPCNYGGFRYFGLCPSCLKQVRILYKANNILACRHCLKLTYQSQNETLSRRFYHKMKKAGSKINEDVWVKPKWMRRKTFSRLRNEYLDFDEKEQIAEYFSLRNNSAVDKIFDKYGGAIFAIEDFCFQRGY
jgi:hypothetical protein